MTPLEQQTLGQRIIATVIIVVAVILLLALIGWLSGGWEAQSAPVRTPHDEHLLELDKQALEDAYRKQVGHVFETWMRDYHLGINTRAATGFSNARKAYAEAQRELEKREQAVKPR